MNHFDLKYIVLSLSPKDSAFLFLACLVIVCGFVYILVQYVYDRITTPKFDLSDYLPITVKVDDCQFVDGSYWKNEEGHSTSSVSLMGPKNFSSEAVYSQKAGSYIVYEGTYNGQARKFASTLIPKDLVSLKYHLLDRKTLLL